MPDEKKVVMVELCRGYGDGYGVVEIDEHTIPVSTQSKPPKYYTDHGQPTGCPIDEATRNFLSQPFVALRDGGVKVPSHAIRRIIGPLDCDEAVRVRAKRYTVNWNDRKFVDLATAEELRSAFGPREEDTYAAMVALKTKYA